MKTTPESTRIERSLSSSGANTAHRLQTVILQDSQVVTAHSVHTDKYAELHYDLTAGVDGWHMWRFCDSVPENSVGFKLFLQNGIAVSQFRGRIRHRLHLKADHKGETGLAYFEGSDKCSLTNASLQRWETKAPMGGSFLALHFGDEMYSL